MKQKRCKVYQAERNGKVIATGFADEVAKQLGCSRQSIIWCGQHEGVADGKYRIATIGMAVKYYDNTVSTEIEPLGETFIERYSDLDNHGNTIMSQKEYKRHQRLIEDKGYNVKYTKIKHGRQKAYYLLEVI